MPPFRAGMRGPSARAADALVRMLYRNDLIASVAARRPWLVNPYWKHVGELNEDAQQPCSVKRIEVRGVTVLCVAGVIDAVTAPALQDSFDGVMQDTPACLIVDLTNVDFLGSAGMTILVKAHEATDADGRFAIVADGPATSRPLQLIGLADVFLLCATLDEAIEAITA